MSEKISVANLREVQSQDLLDQFIKLYDATFTNPSEREDPEQWPDRMWREAPAPQPTTHLLAALSGDDGDEARTVVGGLVFEHYRSSHCGLLTYLVVDERWRRQGVARILVDKALSILAKDEKSAGTQLKAVFCEAEDPRAVSDEKSAMPTCERLQALLRLGARIVDLNYVQPPLVGNPQPCTDLMLLALDVDGTPGENAGDVPGQTVRDFLFEFHQALEIDNPEQDKNFMEMASQLHEDPELLDPREHPVLGMDRVATCLHYIPRTDQHGMMAKCNIFHSMELDIMSYSYQVRPVLASRCETSNPIRVEITFPRYVNYRSEGREMLLLPARRTCRARAMVSSTLFSLSSIRIWHVVLMPDEDEAFSEYDIIKLIHLYDGRTEETNLREKVAFRVLAGEKEREVTVQGLLGALQESLGLPAAVPCAPTGGTIQILIGKQGVIGDIHFPDLLDIVQPYLSSENKQLYEELGQWLSHRTSQGKAILALCGILTGIFDFSEIDMEEVLDTIEPTFISPDSIIRILRGTMVYIAEQDRSMDEIRNQIGISPYLIIPHAVLMHNEYLIEDSEDIFHALTTSPDVKLNVLENSWQKMERNLKRFYLPNIFNYETEKVLYAKGTECRGISERLSASQAKLDELEGKVKAAWTRRYDQRQRVIASLIAFFTVAGLKDFFWEILSKANLESYFWWIHIGIAGLVSLSIYALWDDKRL